MSFSYPVGIRFACSKCGLCCGDTDKKTRHILLLKKDAERIAAHIQKPIETFATKNTGQAPYVFQMQKDPKTGKCLFLKENQCTIYLARPLICRFYPFELTVNPDGNYVFRETKECPAISSPDTTEGETLDAKFFRNLLNLARAEIEEDKSRN